MIGVNISYKNLLNITHTRTTTIILSSYVLYILISILVITLYHEALMQTEIASKRIPCYMHDSASSWRIVKVTKMF